MTEKQTAFIRRLTSERMVPADKLAQLEDMIEADAVSVALGSSIIDWLMTLPFKPGAVSAGTGLELTPLAEGRYAVGDMLIKIDKPEAGNWAGWVFVRNGSEYVDEKFGSQRPDGTYRGRHDDILAVVLDSPLEAAQRYGQVTGHCAVCGRTLEDDESVARGIGPVCWSRVA